MATFKVSRPPKPTKNRRKIGPKMKPKNDREKYRNKSNFGAQKPPKMRSKIHQKKKRKKEEKKSFKRVAPVDKQAL